MGRTTAKAIARALRVDAILQVLRRHSVRDEDLEQVIEMLSGLGCEPGKAARAVRNPSIVEFYFANQEQWDYGCAMELLHWARLSPASLSKP